MTGDWRIQVGRCAGCGRDVYADEALHFRPRGGDWMHPDVKHPRCAWPAPGPGEVDAGEDRRKPCPRDASGG